MLRARLLIAALVLVGTVVPAVGAGVVPDSADRTAQTRSDPANDRIGWENGYWHDDRIDVDQSDGLSDRELTAYVSRAMARVEYVREAEFRKSVPVEVIGREEFRQRGSENNSSDAFGAWNNQVWEALFVSGEESDVQDQLGQTVSDSVAGFYSPADNRIKIITGTPDEPTINNATLVHELTHALQDQRIGLRSEQLRTDTQDGDLATDGLVEGEANLVETLYSRRCGGEWRCVGTPAASGGSGGGGGSNLGILLTLLQPYSDGPVYVNDIRKRGGWDAVRAAYRDPPESTEQVIHRTDESPRPIEFEDRARGDWRLYPNQGENGSDTVGEASIYVMLWQQARAANADTIDPSSIGRTTSPLDTYNYDAEPSAGWANDRLFPYHTGRPNATGGKHGYVWVTEWDTQRDAREFRRAYTAILEAHDAQPTDGGTYVIKEGAFADAFRVVRRGTRVTVVNGPTPAAVENIRPRTGTTTGEGGTTAGDGGTATGSGTEGVAPGFGPAVAVGALVGAVLVLARRRG